MNDILGVTKKIQELLEEIPCSMAENLCDSIESTCNDNKFYLGVVGEFKRGKSTMINSLIDEELLPTDILPTTATINIIEYSDKRNAFIYWNNGNVEEIEATKESLFRFTSEGTEDIENIDYIKIGIDCDLLKNGIVIIDTPGVNDISKTRVEVTKNILPNCDSILFLLDAAAPLTKSEANFLQTKILSYKLSSLMFIISKADRLDEEELEESLEGAEERINQVIDFKCNLIAYSSREVMTQENDNDYKDNLIKYVENLRVNSEENKKFRQKEKLKLIIDLLEEEILKLESINEMDIQKLNKVKKKTELIIKGNVVKFDKLIISSEFVGRKTLHEMFDASFNKMQANMLNEFSDNLRIENNVENYWNRILPIQIERHIRKYSEEKSTEIYNYIKNITKHIIKEYNVNFQMPLLVEQKENGVNIPEWRFEQESKSNIGPMMNRLFPITLGAIIGSIFMPGIGTALGSAGGQALSMLFNENNNNNLREKLIENLPGFLDATLNEYRECVHNTIDESFNKLFDNMTIMHESNQKENLKNLNFNDDTNVSEEKEQKKNNLNKFKNHVENLKYEIEKIVI